MALTDAQQQTLERLQTGLHINEGEPCECGPDDYTTTRSSIYSDGMLYEHHCSNCGNMFETWTEG